MLPFRIAAEGKEFSARLYFASSISAVFNWSGPGDVPEAVAQDPAVAQDIGYAQSKVRCDIFSKG